jgi:SAM-dependent methyltransferase
VIAEHLPSNRGKTLDLGCRDGALASALGLDPRVTIGVDIDVDALTRASGQGRLKGIQADLWGLLPFRSHSFDIVLAGEIIEHVLFPNILIAEAARVLRPDGIALGSTPNSFRLNNRLRFLRGRHFEQDPTHLRQFSGVSLRALLQSHFARVQVHPCVGRGARLAPRLMANDLVFVASKPSKS